MAWLFAGWVAAALFAAAVFSVARRRYRPVTIPREVQDFLRRLEEELAEHPGVELRGMVPGRFAAVFALRGQEIPASLHHLFRRCTAFPERFRENLDRFLDELSEDGIDTPGDHSFADAAPQLLPQVRSRAWLDQHGGTFGDSGLVFRVFNEDLVVCYVIDEPWCMTFVCRAHLRQWGRMEEDLYHLATRNLQQLAGADVPVPDADDEPVLLRTGDGFDAARVLLLDPDRIEGLLVAVPERDLLWLGSEAGDTQLGTLMNLNEAQVEQASHPISPHLYRMTEGQLVPVSADPARSAE